MEASSLVIKGNTLRVQKASFVRSRSTTVKPTTLCMSNRRNCFGLRVGLVTMEAEMANMRGSVRSIFGSSAKSRFIRVQASGLSDSSDIYAEFDLLLDIFAFWFL